MDERPTRSTDFDKIIEHWMAPDDQRAAPARQPFRAKPEVSRRSVETSPGKTQWVRNGEEIGFRDSMLYQLDDAWFFSTREDINLGPYLTKQDAEREEILLVKILEDITDPVAATVLINEFKNRPTCGCARLHKDVEFRRPFDTPA